jgi:molybdopterin-containing oxidoreductase family iron-sulfur binding subunit
MTVDLNKCIGCNGCVVACQAENNVPIVGREQVMNSREMHWLRVDRYFQGDETNAQVVHQPVSCQHCETAPCEQVCPVAATVHTEEGINAMAYNRCIGTRYCANNCPFKVRRFNYFNYNEDIGTGYGIDAYPNNIENANRKLQALVMNPEVTVRGRGVMEKCTYCIQRVEKAKITAIKENREIEDGDVQTACQSACPAKCIEFGNIADPESRVSKSRESPRNYGLLGQLNLKPRTQYLARVSNPHKRLMTFEQLKDLAELKAPHHGSHGSHADSGHHGEEHHGEGHEDHDHGDHVEEHAEGQKN